MTDKTPPPPVAQAFAVGGSRRSRKTPQSNTIESRAASTTERLKRRRPLQTMMLFVVVILISAYFLLPLMWLVISATKNNSQLISDFGFWFSDPLNLAKNFESLFVTSNGIYWRWLLNSFIYAGSAAVISTLLCALAGFAFSKYTFRGSKIMFALVLGSMMVPGTALVLPIFLMMNELGLINTYWAVILPGLVNPVGLFLAKLFWDESLPTELIDAARIDGATDARIFWAIGLPLLRNGLTTIALLSFVGAWNNIFLPLIVLSSTELYPVIQGLSAWNIRPATGVTVDYGAVLLGSLISVVPLVAAFLGLSRYWQSGITAGATKA